MITFGSGPSSTLPWAFSFYFAPFFGADASCGTSLSAQAAAYAFFRGYLGIAAPVNGDGIAGTGFHAYAAGDANGAVDFGQFFHGIHPSFGENPGIPPGSYFLSIKSYHRQIGKSM